MARSAILVLFLLLTLDDTNCQSIGNIPTSLARIESRLDDVSKSTEQMTTLLENHNQQLDTLAEQQNVQNQILAKMTTLLQKHDQQLDNVTDQQNVQNQILTNAFENMASSLQDISQRWVDNSDLIFWNKSINRYEFGPKRFNSRNINNT